ncbi:MAG: glutamine--fructose-6-phosphate transaminase (isomerizing), partial [Thermoanaerobaculaceae bacterium]|nr:glutamine--fructose-6-phosphate transaminase (isomerizing) [Thermoanaerobaculaceae bacterium]
MCGIVGYIGPKSPLEILLEGLKKLEYRGYDSAGIAIIDKDKLFTERSAGKIINLEEKIAVKNISGDYGLGHTRWATHGRPTEENAHPHTDCKKEIVVVHNGILENYTELKQQLEKRGHIFKTETDTEVVAHLLEEEKDDLLAAMRNVCKKLKGIYAFAAASLRNTGKIVAARMGPPIVIGLGENENFVASDIPAILHHTRNIIYLDDGEVAEVTEKKVLITDFDGKIKSKFPQRITWNPIQAEKAGFKHFMEKEIVEQPRALRDTLVGRLSVERGSVYLEELSDLEDKIKECEAVHFVACGTSLHASLCGRYIVEEVAKTPCFVDYASEFRYRDPLLSEKDLTIFVSQSGETADTLAALREAKSKNAKTLAICNVVGSMLTREADGTIFTHAGPEIGVASTKAFTTQLIAIILFALRLSEIKNTNSKEQRSRYIESLMQIPKLAEETLKLEKDIEKIAKSYSRFNNFLYLGRGIHYPIALEGALKLKEISYIHAEGYPAGEMKHGPIALIDENLPVVAL